MTEDKKYYGIDEAISESIETFSDGESDESDDDDPFTPSGFESRKLNKAYERLRMNFEEDEGEISTDYDIDDDDPVEEEYTEEEEEIRNEINDDKEVIEETTEVETEYNGFSIDEDTSLHNEDENHKHFAIKPGSLVDTAQINPFALPADEEIQLDTDEEEEGSLYRYAFNDNHIDEHPPIGYEHAHYGPSRSFSSIVTRGIQIYKGLRSKARRKRAERALTMSEGFTSNIILCLQSWCDLRDRGLLLVLGLVVMFIFMYFMISEENTQTKQISLLIGISILAIRLLWTPVYWFVWGRRVQQKRRTTLRLYDGLNGEAGTAGYAIPITEPEMEMPAVADAEERSRLSPPPQDAHSFEKN